MDHEQPKNQQSVNQSDPAETGAPVQPPHRFRCPSCSADQQFEPVDGTLTCPYCGRKEQIPQSKDQVVERSYEQYLQAPPGRQAAIADGALEVRCDGCGAAVEFVPPQVVERCSFCGREVVAQPKSADPMIAPEGVLPFVVTRSTAVSNITAWINSRWFAPNGMTRLARQDSISGVYLPFWTYDAHTTSYYAGERGEYYYVSENYTTMVNGRQVTQTRQVRRTRWYPVEGTVSRWFDDVLVPATKSVSPQPLERLSPWDLEKVVPYQPEYLAGLRAQRYETEFPDGFERAKEIMEVQIREDVRSDIGGDEQRIVELKTSISGVTFKHLLLPVYLAAYQFKEKTYQVLVNARTGEVVGDRPYSLVKILAAIVLCLAIGGGIYLAAENSDQGPGSIERPMDNPYNPMFR